MRSFVNSMATFPFASTVFYLVLLLVSYVIATPDMPVECKTGGYKQISNIYRSTAYEVSPGKPPLCDISLSPGWYRFASMAGIKMPEHDFGNLINNPQPNHCGTSAPVWLGGKHPSRAGVRKEYNACVNLFGSQMCSGVGRVTVMKCSMAGVSDFYIYKLDPVYSCFMAYCAGDRNVCPYPRFGIYPDCEFRKIRIEFEAKYIQRPKVEVDESTTNTKVPLVCRFNISDKNVMNWKNVTYRVKWLVNGVPLDSETKEICKPPPKALLNTVQCPGAGGFKANQEASLPVQKYKLGDLISCEVTGRYTNYKKDPPLWSNPPKESERFFAGIKVYPGTITINKCQIMYGNNEITIEPTIPVHLDVTFRLPPGVYVDDCKVQLTGTKKKKITITTDCGTLATAAREKFILLYLSNPAGPDPHWGQHLPAVKVIVLKTEIKTCSAVTDPHYTSLNGQYYHFQGHGDYIFYRNKQQNFEVHSRQWFCNNKGTVTCNCAAAIRDRNDVIEFNCCNDQNYYDQVTALRKKVRSKCLSPGTSIRQTNSGINSRFVVIVASGYRVTLERNSWGVDIIVDAPDLNRHEGLCDGDHTHDGEKIWRILPTISLFQKLPTLITDKKKLLTVCECQTQGTCKKVNPIVYAGIRKDNANAVNLGRHCGGSKRSTELSDDPTDDDFDLFLQSGSSHLHSRTKRAVIGVSDISYENATNYCRDKLMENKATKLCKDMVNVDVDNLIRQCAMDVSATGDKSFAVATFAILMRECEENIVRNASLFKNGTLVKNQVVDEIVENLCPNDCTYNGNCTNGTCVCNKGYTATDCSISIYNPPELISIQSQGLCDMRTRPCKKATVFGLKYLDSSNLTCHIEEMKVVDSPWIPNTVITKFAAIMTDLTLIECQLPESPVRPGHFDETVQGTSAAGLCITVSNDGTNPGTKRLKLISFDAACQKCNISYETPCKGGSVASRECYLKENTCLINGYCFASNESNPEDWCRQCLPNITMNQWSRRVFNLPPQIKTPGKRYCLLNEALELRVETQDPEGRPVKLTLMVGPQGAHLSSGKVLYYTPRENKTSRFVFQVSDECNATSTKEINIEIVVCQCSNGGKCKPDPNHPRGSGMYQCDCPDGYTGARCETDIDDCQSNPCIMGTCRDQVNNYTCKCMSGYTGRDCEVNIDDCTPLTCINGDCMDLVNDYFCVCTPGFIGPNCEVNEDDCQSAPCVNGVCVDGVNNFTCNCSAGYTGHRCDIDVNECLSSPCLHGTCNNLKGNFSCNCTNGYFGRTCNIKVGRCQVNSCHSGVNCTNVLNGFKCGQCPAGLSGNGMNCTEINECLSKPCKNGGNCSDGLNGYACFCPKGYSGKNCETDINDCLSYPCQNGGSCIDQVNGFTCTCAVGYTGKTCQTQINECLSKPCKNGGNCSDSFNSYACFCPKGYSGKNCETNINDCLSYPCQNGGSCIDQVNGFTCTCAVGYTGKTCQTEIDECLSKPCKNGGNCSDGFNSYACFCPKGYSGKNCETIETTLSPTTTATGESNVTVIHSTELPTSQLTTTDTDETTDAKSLQPTPLPTETVEVKEERVEISLKDEEWDERLKKKDSPTFIKKAAKIEIEVRKSYAGKKILKIVKVLAFRQGSVIASISLVFDVSDSENSDVLLQPLKKDVETGRIGSLQVDENYFKVIIKEESQKEGKKPKQDPKLVLIVSAAGGGVVLIIVVAIACICKKRSSWKRQRVVDGMPQETAYPRQQKYELPEIEPATAKSTEKLVWVEDN